MGTWWILPRACALISLGWGVTAWAVEVTQAEIENRRCLACHEQSHIGEMPAKDRRVMVVASTHPVKEAEAARPGLLVQRQTLAGSAHAALPCVRCQPPAQTLPPPTGSP